MKKILKVFSMFLMVFILTGCIKYDIALKVNTDETLEMKMKMLVDKEYLTTIGQDPNDFLDEVIGQITSSTPVAGKTKDIKEEVNGKEWVGTEIDFGKQKASKLDTGFKLTTADNKATLEIDMESWTRNMKASEMQATPSQMKAVGVEMVITIEMPQDAEVNIKDDDGIKVTGNKVAVDLLEIDEKSDKLVISSKLTDGISLPMIILGVVGAVLVVGAIVAFIILKKKKADETENTVTTVEETQTETVVEEMATEVSETTEVEATETVSDAAETEEKEN